MQSNLKYRRLMRPGPENDSGRCWCIMLPIFWNRIEMYGPEAEAASGDRSGGRAEINGAWWGSSGGA